MLIKSPVPLVEVRLLPNEQIKLTPEQLLKFEIQLSATTIAVKQAKQELEEARAAATAEGREEGEKAVKLLAIRKYLLRGKLTAQEIAEDLEVSLETVEA